MIRRCASLTTILLLGGLAVFPVRAQSGLPKGVVCTEANPEACNKPYLEQVFREAKTVTILTVPADRMATGQLVRMVQALGKSVEIAETAPNLTLSLRRVNTEGVSIGPAGAPLATLLVYGPDGNGTHGSLIWADTYTGQPDVPWPSVVQAVLSRFQSQLSKR